MKRIHIIILIFGVAECFAQTATIGKVNVFIKEKKYETAFKELDKADSKNENPEIVIAKTNLLLDYFVTSIMHQIFALKDLMPGEDILDIRGKTGSYTMYIFPPDSILMRLIKKYPKNYHLRKTLGYFYHEVHLKYLQRWLQPDTVIMRLFADNYLAAYENGVYDYWSLYGIGYYFLNQKNYKKAITYLEQSAKLKTDYPSSYYNLAYAYLYSDQKQKGIVNAKKALDLYDDSGYKSDAARMIGIIYGELQRYDSALTYYIIADGIQPNDYYTIKPLLEIEVLLSKENYKKRTRQFFLLAPENPTIYQDLLKIYSKKNKSDELIDFFKSQQNIYIDNDKINASLYFYIARIQYDKEDYKNSKLNFEKARSLFKKEYEPDHPVFKSIDSYTNEM